MVSQPTRLTIRRRKFRSLLPLLAIALYACGATATPMAFVESFDGPGLDPAWNQAGNAASHPAAIAGTYDMTHANGDPAGGTKLSRSTAGTLSSYVHEIEVVLDPFLLSGGGGVLSDVKWKSFGVDGFMEFALNSFGDMRLFHNDFSGGAGNIQPNTNLGYTDGDLLKITTAYDATSDTIDVAYSLNNGPAIPYYSGGGVDGPVGDTITNFVEVEVFQFGSAAPSQPTVAIDGWSLTVIPEPMSSTLLSLCVLSFTAWRGRGVAPRSSWCR